MHVHAIGTGARSQRGARLFAKRRRSPIEEGCVCAGLARMELCTLVAPDIYPRWVPNYPGLFSSVQFSHYPIRRRRESFESSVCAIATLDSVTVSQITSLLSATGRRMRKAIRSEHRTGNFAKFEDCECARVTVEKSILFDADRVSFIVRTLIGFPFLI